MTIYTQTDEEHKDIMAPKPSQGRVELQHPEKPKKFSTRAVGNLRVGVFLVEASNGQVRLQA